MIHNGLPDLDSDADRYQNVISWSLGDATPALHKILSKSVGNFFDNPMNPDFGLLDPEGDPDCHQNLSPWSLSMPYHSKKFRQNLFTTFSVIQQTNRPK